MYVIQFVYTLEGNASRLLEAELQRVLLELALGWWRQLAGAAASLGEYNAPGNTHNIHLSSGGRGDVRPALPDLTSESQGGQRGGMQ